MTFHSTGASKGCPLHKQNKEEERETEKINEFETVKKN